MMIVRRLQRQHKSVTLAVPPAMLRLAGLAGGDYVMVSWSVRRHQLEVGKIDIVEKTDHGSEGHRGRAARRGGARAKV